ncbi:MFS transporter, partial [Kutzneria kofuensis]
AGMFGAMSAAPLFAQLAKGVSPTGSGLLMLPMMLGMVVSTALSGKVIARSGRYKMLPVIGCACTAVGMFGFAVVTLDTPLWVPAVLLFVLGIGLGNCTQTLTVAAQNAVPLQDIGTATAAVMFFRQIAGTLGVGAALSALFGALPGAVTDALPQAAGRPDFVIATHDTAVVNNPDNAAFFQFLRGSRAMLSDSSFLDRLDPRLAWPFEQGFSSATGLVFLVGGVLMLLTTLYAMTMRELPLREVSPAQLAESE